MSIRRVFSILLFLELVHVGIRATTDPDMWWHLMTGRYIWSDGIPRQDLFSFTVPQHEWTTHEWLSEVILWAIYSVSGLTGLAIVFALFSGAAFWLVYLCSPGRPYLAGAVVTLAAFTASPSFGVRCQVLNMLLMATFVCVVERVRQGVLSRRAFVLLPLLTVIWANLHSGFLLGVVILAIYAVGLRIDSWRRPPSAESPEAGLSPVLMLTAIACFAAAVINPAGYHLWLYPFDTLGSDLMQKNIIEWTSPDFHLSMYWSFAVLLLGGSLLCAVAPRRPDVTEMLLFFGTAAAGLMSRRHIPLFAIVATPVVSRALTSLLQPTRFYALLHEEPEQAPSRGKRLINWAMLSTVALALVAVDVQKLADNELVIASGFPVAAVDYLEKEGLASARGFNSYVWGGYLIWRELKVFIDGRADVYGDFLGYYLKAFNVTEEWRTPLEEHHVDYALLERDSKLGVVLVASGQWREAYSDDIARIFVRVPAGK